MIELRRRFFLNVVDVEICYARYSKSYNQNYKYKTKKKHDFNHAY